MDLNALFFAEHRDAYIAARLESRSFYRSGTGSTAVAMIGGTAALLRRLAARVETWSHGSADAPLSQPHVSAH